MLRTLSLVLSLASPTLAQAQGLTVHGNFRHMMHTGETAGTVALDALDVASASPRARLGRQSTQSLRFP